MGQNLTLTDLEPLARARIDPDWYEYFASGAATETALRENVEAFRRVRLRQRVLRGIEHVDTTTTILGHPVAHPIVAAPIAYQAFAHAEAEAGVARGVTRLGGAMCLSTFSNLSAAEVAAAAPDGLRFLQVYVFRDHGVTDTLIAQAVELGYRAVVLTVDLPIPGPRDRELRIHWTFPEDSIPAVRFALDHGVEADGLGIVDPTLDWEYVSHLVETAGVPVVVKGILEPEDARLAFEHGAAGIVVSNHGGRQLDNAPATIDVLPSIVDAVADRGEVYLDSGIRRGADVFAALALGARAVLAGRLPLWGLAIDGADGVAAAIGLLRDELSTTMHLTGCSEISEIGHHCLLG
ncbi:MAG: alpha-hydroxy acid oxidase [Gaiellales bacterium]